MKPENFVISENNNPVKVTLVDLGSAQRLDKVIQNKSNINFKYRSIDLDDEGDED